MIKTYRQGATGALLDEYERAIFELQQVLHDISDEELIKVADGNTTDNNCKSIQTILSHVVRSCYIYALYMQQSAVLQIDYPDSLFHLSIKDYQKDLHDAFAFTNETFKNIRDNQLEQLDNNKKIITRWGQIYDIEQMTEHAIVHILRHRRQIEKFKITLRKKN